MTFLKLNKKRYLYIALAVIAVFLFFRYWDNIAGFIGGVYNALIPVIVGAIIAYIINILMNFYERHYFVKKNPPFAQKTRKAVCLIGAILTILVIVALIISLIVPQLISCIKLIVQKMPQAVEVIADKVENWAWLPEAVQGKVAEYAEKLLHLDWSLIMSKVTGFLKTGLANTAGGITSILSSTASVVVAVIVGIIFSIYFLLDGRNISDYWGRVLHVFASDTSEKRLAELAKDADRVFSGYLRGQVLDALVCMILTTVVLLIVGAPNAILVGLMVGFGNLIPYMGPIFGYATMLVVCLPSGNFEKLIIGIICIAVIMFVDGNIINPKLLSDNVSVHPLLVVAALIGGGAIGGLLGMLLAVPVSAFLKLQLDKIIDEVEKNGRKKAKN